MMAGALQEPVDGAIFIFRNASKQARFCTSALASSAANSCMQTHLPCSSRQAPMVRQACVSRQPSMEPGSQCQGRSGAIHRTPRLQAALLHGLAAHGVPCGTERQTSVSSPVHRRLRSLSRRTLTCRTAWCPSGERGLGGWRMLQHRAGSGGWSGLRLQCVPVVVCTAKHVHAAPLETLHPRLCCRSIRPYMVVAGDSK